jgi:acetyl esterase/lipase
VALAAGIVAARAESSIYTATQQEIAGTPGTIIKQEPLAGAPLNASAFRILYRSTGLRGEPIAVSGVLVIPAGSGLPGGRPIVAWQHPTSGVDQACAPSLSPSVLQMIQGLREMLGHGYVVVATDYPGLGTAGQHPYLVGFSEGRAVLDAVRAARSQPGADTGERFVVWGHSQGGHATLFAGLLARDYAPELKLLGVAAAAPATDLTALSKGSAGSADSQLFTAMLMWAWSRVLDAPLDRLVAPADFPAVELLARQCFDPPFDSETQPVEKPMPDVSYKMSAEIAATEPWRSLAADNTPGPLPADIPIFLAQGSADTTIPPEVTARYAERLCHAGSAVHKIVMAGVTHRFIARDAANAAVDWINDRFEGRAAPNDC